MIIVCYELIFCFVHFFVHLKRTKLFQDPEKASKPPCFSVSRPQFPCGANAYNAVVRHRHFMVRKINAYAKRKGTGGFIPGYVFELDNDCTQFHVDTKKHTSIRNVIGSCDYGRLFRNTESKQDRITLLGLLLADKARKFYPNCDWLPLRKEVPKGGEYTLDPFYKDLAEQFVLWHQKNHHRFGAGFFKNKTAIEWIDDFLLSYFPPKYPDSTI